MTLEGTANPYVGPRPIRRNEKLFGRDLEQRRLSNLLVAERIVLLHAPSGAGKSSLLNAGLLPRLEAEKNFQVLPVIRVSRQPEAPDKLPAGVNRYSLSLMHSLEEGHADEPWLEGHLADLDLCSYLDSRWPPDLDKEGQLLVFDQFEEIISQDPYDREVKQTFFTQLGAALQDRRRWALFAMRDDYLGALEAYFYLLPTQLRTSFRLDFLDHDAALEAIRRPSEEGGVPFDEQAGRALVRDLSLVQVQKLDGTTEQQVGPFVEPVQLQVVCNRLWARLSAAGRLEDGIDQSDVRFFGPVSNALAGYYRDTITAVAREQRISEARIRGWIGAELITDQGVRGQVLLGAKESKGLPNPVIARLVDAHLLRQEERRRAIWFELAHDRLVEPVLEDNRKFHEARNRRRLAQAAVAAGFLLVLFLLFSLVQTRQRQAAQATAVAVASQAAVDVVQAAREVTAASAARAEALAGSTQSAALVLKAQGNATAQASASRATATQVALALLPFDQLVAMSTSPLPEERVAAIQALLVAALAKPDQAPRTVPVLMARLQGSENEPAVRLAASQAMLQIANIQPRALAPVVPDLISAVGDPSPSVRINIARLLGAAATTIDQPAQLAQVKDALTRLSTDPDPMVQIAAHESQADINAVSIQTFVANWVNVDPETHSWSRLEVNQEGNALKFHIFGKCYPTDCDAGVTMVPFTGGTLAFPINNDFSQRTFTVTLETESDKLWVETFTRFIDNSGRSDYLSIDRFARQSAVIATPTVLAQTLPDDQLLVALFWENKGLAIIDRNTNQVIKTVIFPSINARFLSVNPVRKEAYVSFSNGDTFYIVSTLTGEIIGKVAEEVGWNSDHSAVSPDGLRVYLATSGGPEGKAENKVLVIDPAVQQVLKVIRLGPFEFPLGLEGIEISPDGRTLYTLDTTARALLAIDTTSGEVIARLPNPGDRLLDISPAGDALYLADGDNVYKLQVGTWKRLWNLKIGRETFTGVAGPREVYFLDSGGNRVLRVDNESGNLLAEININRPGGAALSPDDGRLYVSSTDEHVISILDLQTGKVIDKIPLEQGTGPTDLVILSQKSR